MCPVTQWILRFSFNKKTKSEISQTTLIYTPTVESAFEVEFQIPEILMESIKCWCIYFYFWSSQYLLFFGIFGIWCKKESWKLYSLRNHASSSSLFQTEVLYSSSFLCFLFGCTTRYVNSCIVLVQPIIQRLKKMNYICET